MYILRSPYASSLEKYVLFAGDELPLVEEAELWGETPYDDALPGRGYLCADHAFGVEVELELLEEVLSCDQVAQFFRITTIEDANWPKIYEAIVNMVAETNHIHPSYVVLHDLTNPTGLIMYVVEAPDTNKRFYAASVRPLTATEVRVLRERQMFDQVLSPIDARYIQQIVQIIGDIRLQPSVAAAELEVTLICVTAEPGNAWEDITQTIASIIARRSEIPFEEMRIEDLTTAA